jgi:hypothetical protein
MCNIQVKFVDLYVASDYPLPAICRCMHIHFVQIDYASSNSMCSSIFFY